LKVPLIDLTQQHKNIGAELRRAALKPFDTQRFVLGDFGREFEAKIAKMAGAKHAVGLASGTDALLLALTALNVKAGDEVVTTPFTFFATAGCVSRVGARPVFADIDESTFNLDPDKARAAVTRKTKALIPVHLFGLPCDMKEIMAVGRARSIAVVEDAAQALGAEYGGKGAGTIGDFGCYSFYPTKNLGGAGDGGMLVTSSDALADKIRVLRDHGARKKYHHDVIGVNSRLDEIQAAVLLVKLKYLARWNAARRVHAAEYSKAFRDLPLEIPAAPAGRTHIYHLYSVLTDRRDALAAFLAKKGIGSGVYYPLPMHLQPCYKHLGYKKGDFPVTERVAARVLSLPMYPELSRPQKERVIDAVREFFKK
jgi:dTDP-4-amino-4,6-dideoxygalactose transaminase